MPDAHYEVKSFATDVARNNVAAYAIFYGTHTGEGGPVPRLVGKSQQTMSTLCNSKVTESRT